MKEILIVASLSGILLASCITSEEACLQECSSLSLKVQNKCDLDHPDDHSHNLECSIRASKETTKCMGKCVGNL